MHKLTKSLARQDDKAQGDGKFIHSDGDVYHGQWQDDKAARRDKKHMELNSGGLSGDKRSAGRAWP